MVDAIKSLVPNAKFAIIGDDLYENINWQDERPIPTQTELDAKIAELQALEPMRVLREKRNLKLAENDWRASSDLTLSSEWSTYRQALRDLPSTATPTLDDNGNLQNVTWPDEPT